MAGGVIAFTIPGVMRGKQRAGRLVLPGGKVRSFNPRKTANLEHAIKQEAALQMRGRSPFKGAMRLCVRVWKVAPKSWSLRKIAAAYWVTGKPDPDNALKLISDACNKIVWHDDAQIAVASIERRYGETERTDIEITALEGE